MFLRLRFWLINYLNTNFLPYWRSPSFIYQAGISFLLLYIASIVNSLAGINATEHAGSSTTDIILSNTTRLDTSFIHGWLSGIVKDLTLCFLFLVPRYFPFAVKSAAFLMIVRAIFVNLTNIGMFPDSIPVNSLATYGGDLFFSGHVAFAYMNALIFWEKKWLRNIFLLISIFLGTSALLGHYHYSIDIFAAPFITYGIFALSKQLFIDDYNLLKKGI